VRETALETRTSAGIRSQTGPDLARLLRVCAGTTILATSRVPLRVAGEHEFPVLLLEPPDALALFAERARAVRPAFALTAAKEATVANVCRELDGLTLAIELAAARAKDLSPEAVLARLEQRPTLLTGGLQDAPPASSGALLVAIEQLEVQLGLGPLSLSSATLRVGLDVNGRAVFQLDQFTRHQIQLTQVPIAIDYSASSLMTRQEELFLGAKPRVT
jgi:hypothetical protein